MRQSTPWACCQGAIRPRAARGIPVVIAQGPAEAIPADHTTALSLVRWCGSDAHLPQALVIALGISEAEPTISEIVFEDAIFHEGRGDGLLLLPPQPAGNHGDEHVQNHGLPSGWRLDEIAPPVYTQPEQFQRGQLSR